MIIERTLYKNIKTDQSLKMSKQMLWISHKHNISVTDLSPTFSNFDLILKKNDAAILKNPICGYIFRIV